MPQIFAYILNHVIGQLVWILIVILFLNCVTRKNYSTPDRDFLCFYPCEIIKIHHECPCRIRISPKELEFKPGAKLAKSLVKFQPQG